MKHIQEKYERKFYIHHLFLYGKCSIKIHKTQLYWVSFIKLQIQILQQIEEITMEKLIQLTAKIRKWNMMGHSLLPQLQIVVISGKIYQQKSMHIINLFECNQLKVNNEQSTDIYKLYIMGEPFHGRIHYVLGLSDTQIKDYQFRQRKKYIQKFRRHKDILFIIFSNQDRKQLDKNQQHLVEFGLGRNFDKVIYYDQAYSDFKLIHEILLKYENSFRFDLVTNYKIMKDQKKEFERQTKRYIQWKKVINNQVSPLTFSLINFKFYADSMISSFSGTYSNSSHFESLGLGKSINWKVMQLLHQFWEVQSDLLFKQVDSFPLSYIQQQYKMSDHYSIGGFLPDTCFKAIFSPPLYELRNSLMSTIENIKQFILRHIQLAIIYTFQHTTIQQLAVDRQLQNIEAICDKFISELSNSLESQIQFIHANPEDFWNYRQLNTSIYSAEQQVYIQIKYIGKSYVRKVFESIKDSVPRYIGQNLLKRIVKYMSQESFNTFIGVTKQKQFGILLTSSQIQKYETNMLNLKQLDNLISFFSLKVNSSFLIKNFYQKRQKQWDRMFGRIQQIKIQQKQEQIQQGGILRWMKNLLKRNKNPKNQRRANSGQKKAIKPKQNEEINSKQNQKQKSKNLIINQKNWLLIINTGREVSHQRIKMSAIQGFPTKFRSSIWMYLSTNKKPKQPKLKTILQQQPRQETVKQIQKDIPRTTPGQLFRYSLKSSLKNVLVGYSIHDKQTQYTQGMNFITSIILTTLINYGEKSNPLIQNRMNYEQVEQKAFCILKHIMEQCGVRKLMKVQASTLADLSLRLNTRIQQLSPKMTKLISETPFNCQMLFSSPLISCLSNVTSNLTMSRRFLDILITHDFFIIYRIIAQFVAHSQFMIGKINGENVYDFLKNKMYDAVYGVIGDQGLSKMFSNL